MTEIVERVARAICRQDHPCWSMVDEMFADERLDGTGRTPRMVYSDLAHAAIEAMREPSEEMMEAAAAQDDVWRNAAVTLYGSTPPNRENQERWKAMIDAALEQGT